MSPPTKRTTTIEDLPPEMIYELFKHLPPKDLVAGSMVNKRWHFIYSNLRLHSLAAADFDDLFRWHQSNQPIQKAEQCCPTMFLRLVEKPLLSNLKHLALGDSEFEFDLNKLNRFQKLLHLEINYYLHGKAYLNLPRLKVLVLQGWNHHCALSIDCPQLITLLYAGEEEDENLLKVKHPETIRKLKTDMVVPRWLASFKSVECLGTRRFEAISKATFISLPELRELHYDGDIEWVIAEGSRHGPGTVDRMKQKLNEFLDEAKKLRGNEFQFTFCGFRLTNVNVDQIDFGVQVHEESGREYVHNEYIYMKNYQLIEPGAVEFVEHVDYTGLLSHVTGEFPLCFSHKFTNIRSVYATTKVQDPDHFLWFLKSLRFLIELWLEDTELAQEFYDQLPASAHSLFTLELRVGHCENELQLNFDFIGSFSYLSELVINSIISLELLPSLVRSVGKLELGRFDIRSREKIFKIYKWIGSDEWAIKRADGVDESLFETENPDEILNFFDGLQGAREKCNI